MGKEQLFTTNEIEIIKENISGEDLIEEDELDFLIEQKKQIYNSDINLSKLIVRIYDFFRMYKDNLNNRNLNEFINRLEVEDLRNYLRNYENGQGIGDHYIKMDIIDNLNRNRKDYETLIILFFKVFGENSD